MRFPERPNDKAELEVRICDCAALIEDAFHRFRGPGSILLKSNDKLLIIIQTSKHRRMGTYR